MNLNVLGCSCFFIFFFFLCCHPLENRIWKLLFVYSMDETTKKLHRNKLMSNDWPKKILHFSTENNSMEIPLKIMDFLGHCDVEHRLCLREFRPLEFKRTRSQQSNSMLLKVPFNCSLTATPRKAKPKATRIGISASHCCSVGCSQFAHLWLWPTQQCYNLGFMFIISDCELGFFF